jgi:hypothetical protein
MRRLSAVVLGSAILVLPAFSHSVLGQDAAGQPAAQPAAQQAAPAPQKFTMEGDVALWSVAIRPDKTADYEQVMTRVKDVLQKSEDPMKKQQASGWKVVKSPTPMKDGNIIYTHIITPVPGADYAVLQVLYAVVTDPAEQKNLYELYRGAFVGTLGLSSGSVVLDMSK